MRNDIVRGYVFISEKKQSNEVMQEDIKEILESYNDLTDIQVRIAQQTPPGQKLFTFTNELKKINYTLGKYEFATSGSFIFDEQDIFKSFIDAKDKKSFISKIGGINTLSCFVDGKFTAWNNVTRVEPIYWAETSERIVVGTKAILVHLLVHNIRTPQYEPSKMLSFLNNGFYADENMPFKGVNILGPNSSVSVDSNVIKLDSIDNFKQELYSIKPTQKDYDDLAQAFLDSFLYFKKAGVELSTGLTGGKDSRVIVAAMNYLGIDFNAHTNGYESNPDVVIAERIAKTLNIKHKVNAPAISKNQINVDLYRRTINAIKNSEGLLYSYENVGNNYTGFKANKMKFGGQGGAVLKGGYAGKRQFIDKAEVERFMLNAFIKYKDFFEKETVADYVQFIRGFIENETNHLKANDILNYFFLKYRTGRWSSGSMPLYTTLSHVYFPLFENQLVKKAQLIETEFGKNDQILYNILQRISPELIDIPFADDRWNFESTGPYHRYSLDQWITRMPVQATSKLSGFNWRKNVLNTSKKQFEEVILGYESSALYDIVNKSKVEKLFTTKVQNSARYDALLWSLYTGNILLSNEWYQPIEKKSRMSIEIPKRNTQKIEGVTDELRHIPSGVLVSKDGNLSLLKLDEVTSIVEWKKFEDEKMYLQIFDGAFTMPPTDQYKKYTHVIGKKAKFKFEIEKIYPTDFELEIYFIQYDEKARIKSEAKSFFVQNHKMQYEIEIPLLMEAKYFKVAFRISKTPLEGKFSLNQMYIEFLN